MNNFEIEYLVDAREFCELYIDEDYRKIAYSIRNKRTKSSLKIYLLFLILTVFILIYFTIKININQNIKAVILIISMLILIAFQKIIVDMIYDKIKKHNFKENLTDEFIERISNKYEYRY